MGTCSEQMLKIFLIKKFFQNANHYLICQNDGLVSLSHKKNMKLHFKRKKIVCLPAFTADFTPVWTPDLIELNNDEKLSLPTTLRWTSAAPFFTTEAICVGTNGGLAIL